MRRLQASRRTWREAEMHGQSRVFRGTAKAGRAVYCQLLRPLRENCMLDLTVHKAPLARPHIKLTVLLVDRGGRKGRALEWLASQTLPRYAYELMWIELHAAPAPQAGQLADWVVSCRQLGGYHLHRAYNAGVLLAAGSLLVICDADASGPVDFLQSIVEHFEAPSADALLRYRGMQAQGDEGCACVALRRADAIRFGGFDEHPLWRDAAGSVETLVRRMLDHGVRQSWHARIGIDAPPAERSAAAGSAQDAWRSQLEVFSQQRMLPIYENVAINALRDGASGARASSATLTAPRPQPLARPAIAMPTQRPPIDPASPRSHAAAAVPDWRDIPVFIVNRNRLDALQRLVTWLLDAGTRKVVILDNASNYEPLLHYYEALPTGAQVLRLDQNFGPYVLWKQGVHQVLDTPFVLTDSDVVPVDGCPKDLIGRLHEALRRWPDAEKVGCALRIDDLPDTYAEADTVRKWESQFWEHPVAPGVYAAPIDTTFALYPPFAEFSNAAHNLRLGWPCVMEHTPWYADEQALSDEELHYRTHTSAAFSNWSVAKKESWLRRCERVLNYDARPSVLNLDGGRHPAPGWINAAPDATSAGHPQVIFDPAATPAPRLPIADDALDGIHVSHVLENVVDLPALMNELWRAAKPGARLHVREPHGQGPLAWSAQARRGFGEASLGFLAQPALGPGAWIDYHADWALHSVQQVTAADGSPLEIVAVLEAVKPARGRGPGRATLLPPVTASSDGRIDPGFAVIASPVGHDSGSKELRRA